MPSPIIAQALAESLRPVLRQAEIDHEAFARPMKACQLEECRATCCHDGVVLDDLEVPLLATAREHHSARLASYGIDLSGDLFPRTTQGSRKTATIPALDDEHAVDFPEHFPRTRCVFLDREHRCAWQRLATDLGEHPWTYKPVSCWMHPVALQQHPSLILTVAGEPTDPTDFSSQTPCGAPCPGGAPASAVLAPELAMLGLIAGRDLCEEIATLDRGK
ncbi:MAG: hypothetical protein ACI8T1_000851 [Verrucomicrobiales bacterium]|jgi:hypothetical protein